MRPSGPIAPTPTTATHAGTTHWTRRREPPADAAHPDERDPRRPDSQKPGPTDQKPADRLLRDPALLARVLRLLQAQARAGASAGGGAGGASGTGAGGTGGGSRTRGGPQRTSSGSARTAGRAAAYRAGDAGTLQRLGLDYNELRSLGDERGRAAHRRHGVRGPEQHHRRSRAATRGSRHRGVGHRPRPRATDTGSRCAPDGRHHHRGDAPGRMRRRDQQPRPGRAQHGAPGVHPCTSRGSS